jgi:hypothetical protein
VNEKNKISGPYFLCSSSLNNVPKPTLAHSSARPKKLMRHVKYGPIPNNKPKEA